MIIKNKPKEALHPTLAICRFNDVPIGHYFHFITPSFNGFTHFYKMAPDRVCTENNATNEHHSGQVFTTNTWVMWAANAFSEEGRELRETLSERRDFRERFPE
jgi:hypothetical protein